MPSSGTDPGWDGEAAVNVARQKVQTYLLRESEIGLDQKGRVTIDRGSTRVFLEFFPQSEKRVVYVTLTAPIAFFVPVTAELHEYLARNSDKWYFGHLAMNPYPDDSENAGKTYVYLTDTVIGEFVDPEELSIRTFSLINTANAIDEQFVETFGGSRYQDT